MNKSFNSKKLIYGLILFAEGCSLMAVELLGARLTASFYGNSLLMWTSILLSSILGLSAGYYLSGKLSRRYNGSGLLSMVLLLSATIVLLLPKTCNGLITITSDMALFPGILIAGLILMFPPMLCFGMVGPQVVKQLTQSLEELGKVSGTVFFISTTGSILSAFLFGLYLIPFAGIKFSVLVISVTLVLLPLPALFMLNTSKNRSDSALKTAKTGSTKTLLDKIKRKNHPLERIPGIYVFAIIEGAAVMALELISARMLAPWFGSSLHTWAVVIGLTLTGLATGYYLGGRIPAKTSGMNSLWTILLSASSLILLMHVVSCNLPVLLSAINPLVSLFLTALLLILPPLMVLGSIPTLLIRQITASVHESGTITGRVFTVSSLSGILALPLFGFWLIPEFGLIIPSVALGVIIGIYPFLVLIRKKKPFGWIYPVLILVSLLLIPKWDDTGEIKILYHSEGLMGQVVVVDIKSDKAASGGKNLDGRYLFVNRMGQSQLNPETGTTGWNYSIFISAVASRLPEGSKALVLGGGGGLISTVLSRDLNLLVETVELDQRIEMVSHRFFGLDPAVKTIIDDARHYLQTTREKYDVIIFDLFRGEVQPAHVLNLEAFKKAGSLLTAEGMLIINFNGYITGEAGKPARSIFSTLVAAGFETKILPTPGEEKERNLLFIASFNNLKFNNLRTPLAYHGKEVPLDLLFHDTLSADFRKATVFTDDKPILEWMNLQATIRWRKDYNESFTKLFLQNGIPLY